MAKKQDIRGLYSDGRITVRVEWRKKGQEQPWHAQGFWAVWTWSGQQQWIGTTNETANNWLYQRGFYR